MAIRCASFKQIVILQNYVPEKLVFTWSALYKQVNFIIRLSLGSIDTDCDISETVL